MVERDHRRRTSRGLVSAGAVVVALLVAGLVPGAPARAVVAGTSSARPIPPPVSHGQLKITGDMADGGVVEAKGLSWAPPDLPSRYRILSLQVAYDWQACAPQGGPCVTASDTTATPFAASRYIVGHADVGKLLKLTETATEVVETDPATFSFSVARASVTTTTTASVQGFAGGAPTTEFVNGTPEHRTASTEEYFQVDPPHFDAADGTPRIGYRVDGGPWKMVSSTYRFYTGTLEVGSHRVTVRTSNAAGTTTRSFHWQVVPMPAPVPCVAPPSGACWYPPHLDSTNHPMRWDWQIGRVTPLERTGSAAVDIYDIDGFLTTTAEVKDQDAHTWQAATLPHPKAVCYLDLAWEDYRPDGSPTFREERSRRARSATSTTGIRRSDGSTFASSMPSSRCSTRGSTFSLPFSSTRSSWTTSTASTRRPRPGSTSRRATLRRLPGLGRQRDASRGMTVLWKNTGILSAWGRDYSDGAVVEECYVYHARVFSPPRSRKALIEHGHHLYRALWSNPVRMGRLHHRRHREPADREVGGGGRVRRGSLRVRPRADVPAQEGLRHLLHGYL